MSAKDGQMQRICVVTGGRGFAARHLVVKLIESNEWSEVRISDLSPSITLDDYERHGVLGQAFESHRASYFSADLRDKPQVLRAFEGVCAVFHMAAPDSSINSFKLHYSVSVQGTKNVIDACFECNVRKLIYTSSPSVVFDGIHGIYNGEESLPYPDKHNDIYSETKAQAEVLVLQANGKNGLLTCAIRPSSIFGPGDKLMVPSLVAAARAGKSKFIIGDGENLYDFTYVENVAHAHICAERALDTEKVGNKNDPSGKAYFITNMEPIKFWEFMSILLERLGYQRPKIHIPAKAIMPIACMVEFIFKQLGPYRMPVPQLTPSRVRLLSCYRTFSCMRAQNLIGYTPIISLKDGIERTVESYSHLRAEVLSIQSRELSQPSKAFRMLQNDKVAHVLLWRDEKLTMMTMAVVITLMTYYFISAYTFLSTTANLLLLLTTFSFFYSFLPSSIFGYTFKRIPSCFFQISEETVQCITQSCAFAWNNGVTTLKALSEGRDWMLFLKTVAILFLIKVIGTVSLKSLAVAGLVFMFTGFYIYEKKEEEIDNALKAALDILYQLKESISRKVRGRGYLQEKKNC